MLLASFEPEALTPQVHLLAGGVKILFVLVPLLLLARFWPHPIFRIVFRTWALVACSLLFFLPASLLNPTAHQARTLLHFPGLALLIILIFLLDRKYRKSAAPEVGTPGIRRRPTSIRLLVFLFCGLYALPWLAWGALGSFFDSLLQLLLGFSFAIAGSLLLETLLFRPLSEKMVAESWGWSFLLLGFASSTALFLLTGAVGFPFGTLPIILMVIASISGWLVAGLRMLIEHRGPVLRQQTGPWIKLEIDRFGWSLAALCCIVLTLPLLMFDPDELGLILGLSSQEILRYALQSTALAFLVIMLFALLVLLLVAVTGKTAVEVETKPEGAAKKFLALTILLLVTSLSLLGYFKFGQPGLHGERLFIILKSQADLGSIDPHAAVGQRRQAVYDRLVEHSLATQQQLRQRLDDFGVPYTSYYLVNAIETTDSPLLRLWLLSRPEVDRVIPSPRLRPLPEPLLAPGASAPQDPPQDPPVNITQIHADRVWRELNVTGEGILIGNADSGVQADHPNLAANYRGNGGQNDYSWLDPWFGTVSPVDPNGHGTHTLGTILGKYTGVAPGAQWIACANLPRNLGNPALYLDCWQFLFAPYPQGADPFTAGKPELGAQVFNNSWGCPPLEGCDPDVFLSAVNSLRLAGIFLAVGAGNEGPACSSINDPPATYRQVFSVGAVDERGSLADFSSRGPVIQEGSSWIKPDLVAPGVQILSSVPGSAYKMNSGTSMAGPHLAGTVALIWSANPALVGDIEQTERILRASAHPYQGTLPDCPAAADIPSSATGYGILDAYAAVLLALDFEK